MTYQLYRLPASVLFTGGVLAPGWKVYFYLTGTTTPTPVYTTSALNVAHTQPVEADSAGVMPLIYLDPSIVYKSVVYDENDVLQSPFGADPVNDSVLSQSVIGQYLWPRTAEEIAAGVTPSYYYYSPGNVLRYGADASGATSSQTAFDAALDVSAAGLGFVDIPAGDFKVNWVIQDAEGDYLWVKTAGFQTRLLPVSSASPVVDIYGTTGGNGVTGLRFESCLIDSQLSGSPTGAGVGFRVRASNPGFVWKAKIGHIYIRGFDDGLVIDCDVNLGEVFDNDFDQIEVVSCDDRSLDIKGIYNRFGRIFVTESGNYAMVNASSACTFEQIVTDGPVTFSAAGGWIGLLAIEGTNGSGATSLIDLSGPNYTFDNIVCKDIPNAKYTYGLAVSGSSTGLFFGSIVFTGTVPPQPILLTAGSAGIIGNASIPSGTKISTSTSVIATWRFIGDVSSAFQGDRYLDPNLLVQYTGETVAKGPLYLTAAATNPGAGNVALGKSTATSIGAAGGASALPATPLGYLIAYVGTTQVKIPYYNA